MLSTLLRVVLPSETILLLKYSLKILFTPQDTILSGDFKQTKIER